MKEAFEMDGKIYVPYNEKTKQIYETFAKVAIEIAERKQVEREMGLKAAD
jgi:hypothetical protein